MDMNHDFDFGKAGQLETAPKRAWHPETVIIGLIVAAAWVPGVVYVAGLFLHR